MSRKSQNKKKKNKKRERKKNPGLRNSENFCLIKFSSYVTQCFLFLFFHSKGSELRKISHDVRIQINLVL